MYRLVGISFGLLCIIQSAINVCLRLQGVGPDSIMTVNFTDDIEDTIAEKNLIIDQLNKDKEQLDQEKQQLLKDKVQLVQEKRKLAKEKKELQNINNQIKNQACPPGWFLYKFSCYQYSCMIDTWEYAKQDCESKGAHLVILNDDMEEKTVRWFGAGIMWMGLTGQRKLFSSTWSGTWVDGSLMFPIPKIQLQGWRFGESHVCISFDGNALGSNTWFSHDCQEHHHWMCEKENFHI